MLMLALHLIAAIGGKRMKFTLDIPKCIVVFDFFYNIHGMWFIRIRKEFVFMSKSCFTVKFAMIKLLR